MTFGSNSFWTDKHDRKTSAYKDDGEISISAELLLELLSVLCSVRT